MLCQVLLPTCLEEDPPFREGNFVFESTCALSTDANKPGKYTKQASGESALGMAVLCGVKGLFRDRIARTMKQRNVRG